MSNIVSFNKEVEKIEPMIWGCDCGNHSFLVYSNGALECAGCEALQEQDAHYQTVKKWTRKRKEWKDDNI